MNAPDTPLDLLARELGDVAGRIERDNSLRMAAIEADIHRKAAELELRILTIEGKAANIKDGEKGLDGLPGSVGDRGETGKTGEKGADGAAGPIGEPGEPGERGIDGAPGLPGIQGVPGERGSDGLAGLRGEPGEKGMDGAAGSPGPAGEPGKLPVVRTWADEVHYEGSVVTHDGGTWQARCDTGRSPPHEDWACLARSGRDGVDGASFRVCGTWNIGQQYEALNVVILNGGAFVAKQNDPGACPGEGWQLMASQGKQGKPGERGPAGPKGDTGPAGSAVIGMSVDDEGVITLVSSDGLIISCDLYPVLSRLNR